MLRKFSTQQRKAAAEALKAHRESPFVSYEWLELVNTLSRSSDPHLREKMQSEIESILVKEPGLKKLVKI